jgi:hypothetical protein
MLWSQVVKTANYQEDALSVPLPVTRISCFVALDRTACAPFREERHVKFASTTNLDRKPGVAEYPLTLRFLEGEGIQSGKRGKSVVLNNEQLTIARIPCEAYCVDALHAAFLDETRARGRVQRSVPEIRVAEK